MEADIIERIHALVEDSVDDESMPDVFSSGDCYSAVTCFDPLFGTYCEPPATIYDAEKRTAAASAESRLSIKLLIPAASVGPLIGKGGFFMRTLQHECFVNICPREMSYPATTDRIALLKGRFSSVLNVTERITQHIKERCPKAKRQDEYSVEESMAYEVRLLVPHTSAGILIGKNGATVKEIRERTGCVINIHPRSLKMEDCAVPERVIVIAHDCISFAKKAVEAIFEKVASDPCHASEISKLDHLFSTRPSRRMSAPPLSPTVVEAPFSFSTPFADSGWTGGGSDIPGDLNKIKSYVARLVAILQSMNCADNVITDTIDSIKTLSSRGILELALSVGMHTFFGATAVGGLSNASDENRQNDHVSVSRPVLEVLMSESGALPDGTNYAASVIEDLPAEDCVQLKIPERIVGAVIGPKAKTLTDIQHFTRCRVQMERKDPNSSPDGMRTLSLFGEQIAQKRCRALMERLINDEHRRRLARHLV